MRLAMSGKGLQNEIPEKGLASGRSTGAKRKMDHFEMRLEIAKVEAAEREKDRGMEVVSWRLGVEDYNFHSHLYFSLLQRSNGSNLVFDRRSYYCRKKDCRWRRSARANGKSKY